MSARTRSIRGLFGLALAAALVLGPIAAARADQASTEPEVGTPAPEPAAAVEPTGDEDTVTSEITVVPVGETPLTAEPVEAVHRPRGFWAPFAIAADLLVMRPIGLVSLAAGGAAFVAVSPVAAATQTLGDRVDTLADRAKNVFTRPLGAL